MEADVSCDGGVVIWRQACRWRCDHMGVDVSSDGGVVIWRQMCGVFIWRHMCHVIEVWSYGGRCVM